jgi:transcriptional regulator
MMRAVTKTADLLQGTLDLLILRTLELRPLHGVGIADRIEQVTRGVFVVGPGSLFPALHRLADKGWIAGEWGELENRRRAKFYALTAAGRAQLAREKKNWQKVHTAVNQVLAEET